VCSMQILRFAQNDSVWRSARFKKSTCVRNKLW
jgi:hypothetical protein